MLGYTPHVPGLLMEEQTGYNPAHLDPSTQFLEKVRLQQEAAKATAQADGDRLRRALLRKFMGQQSLLSAGDLCYYWRDASAGSTAKLRWRGPATVIMREPGPAGFHSTCLKHCACHEKLMPGHMKCCTCHAKSSSQS